jgi:hypothetical protein
VYQQTSEMVNHWSDWSTYHTRTRRYVQVDRYTQRMSDTYTLWSNGAWYDTGWQQQSLTHTWQYWWVLTVDPNRVSARWDGGLLPWTGLTFNVPAAQGATGECGLTGTVTSCLAQISAPPVGGGCAGLDANVNACEPIAPMPGDPNPLRESSSGTGCAVPTWSAPGTADVFGSGVTGPAAADPAAAGPGGTASGANPYGPDPLGLADPAVAGHCR